MAFFSFMVCNQSVSNSWASRITHVPKWIWRRAENPTLANAIAQYCTRFVIFKISMKIFIRKGVVHSYIVHSISIYNCTTVYNCNDTSIGRKVASNIYIFWYVLEFHARPCSARVQLIPQKKLKNWKLAPVTPHLTAGHPWCSSRLSVKWSTQREPECPSSTMIPGMLSPSVDRSSWARAPRLVFKKENWQPTLGAK